MIKKIIYILPITLLMAFSAPTNKIKSLNNFNLTQLSNGSEPQHIELINVASKQKTAKGILFSFKSRKAGVVKIAGSFSRWKKLPMKRNSSGVWYYFLAEPKNETVKYKFIIDGIWSLDPKNPMKDDDMAGSFYSIAKPIQSSIGTHLTYKKIGRNKIEFRLYNKTARFISIVGDFNHWNPENDILKKDNNGIWKLTKYIPSGSYRYKFIVDGKWITDLYNTNQNSSDDTGEVCSTITIK